MRKRVIFIIAFLAASVLLTKADNLGFTKAHPLLFGLDMDYAPLEYVNKDGMPQGLDVEFTKILMKRLNIPFTYSPNNWINVSGDVLNGRVDLGMMTYSTYRANVTNYSNAVFRIFYQLVFRKEDKDNINVRNLYGKEVAYMPSRPMTDTLNHAGAKPIVVTDLPQAMRDLSEGKYDAIICFRYQVKYLISELELDNLKTLDLPYTPREYCYVSQSKQLIEVINKELELMESEGIVNEIYGDYLLLSSGVVIPDWVWALLAVLIILSLCTMLILQRRYQNKLRIEMERAQRSEQFKNVFLGNVSHALRTPLNSIIGFSEIIASDHQLSLDERQQMGSLINKGGQQLLYFIDEILQLSNFEANRLKLDRKDVNLKKFMEQMAEETRQKVKPGVKVVVEGSGGHVNIDLKLMQIVTRHALDNAARHTLEGTITLSYRPEADGLRIEVRDTGEGLPKELRRNIFSLLSEENTYIQKDVPGLGLTICKAIVERCGGKIGAESPPEGGTILWHWIPRKVK